MPPNRSGGSPRRAREARRLVTRDGCAGETQTKMIKSHLKIVLAVLGLAVASPLGLPGEALAQPAAKDAAKHPVVVYTEGQRANATKEDVLGVLPSTADVKTSDEFRKALAK